MGDGMPYHLEKGPLLRIFEAHLNGDRATLQATLNVLRVSEQSDSLDWILTGVPALWSDPAFALGPQSGVQMRDRVLMEWFGYESDGAGGWRKPHPPRATTGYWIGYRGDVDRIVRRALLWATELALATGSDGQPNGDGDPWPIELFWKCPAPWFEAWVVSRRVPTTAAGLVTVVLVTPSHQGADVATSPIASSPVATPPGATHPVPSWQDDYECLAFPRPPSAAFPVSRQHPVPGRPRVPARDRDFATWVVTHEQHAIAGDPTGGALNALDAARRARQANTAGPREFTDMEIPQLAEWEGTGDVVVVSPSMAAGGIKHDGQVV
jgi:hypothetical protein